MEIPNLLAKDDNARRPCVVMLSRLSVRDAFEGVFKP